MIDLAPRTLYLFDLDGTLTAEELLPRIAREAELEEEIAVLTAATMQGLLPVEASFRLRTRLLRDVPCSRVRTVVAFAKLQLPTLLWAQRHREDVYVVTGNLDVWVSELVADMGLKLICSQARTVNDRLTVVHSMLNKGDAVRQLRASHPHSRIVAIGDGMNDVPMFEAADVAIAHAGTHPPAAALYQLADYYTPTPESLCLLLDTL